MVDETENQSWAMQTFGQKLLNNLNVNEVQMRYSLQAKQLLIIHTYHSRFIPEGVAEVSQIFLQNTHILPILISYEEHCRRDRW
jgi:hypothetical protein